MNTLLENEALSTKFLILRLNFSHPRDDLIPFVTFTREA